MLLDTFQGTSLCRTLGALILEFFHIAYLTKVLQLVETHSWLRFGTSVQLYMNIYLYMKMSFTKFLPAGWELCNLEYYERCFILNGFNLKSVLKVQNQMIQSVTVYFSENLLYFFSNSFISWSLSHQNAHKYYKMVFPRFSFFSMLITFDTWSSEIRF